MRDLFIGLLEKVINVIVVVAAVAIVIAAIAALFGGSRMAGMPGGMPGGGIMMSLAILIGGGLYLIIVAGFMYLGLGIYQNTKRTAELLEKS